MNKSGPCTGDSRIALDIAPAPQPLSVDLLSVQKSNSKISLATKIKRGLWNIAWLFLFRYTPKRICNRWRLFLLRFFGAIIAEQVFILPSCKILQPWLLKVGRASVIGADVEVYNFDWVTIGDMSVVSQYTYLCTGTHDFTQPDFPLTWKPITIGSECWVAADAFIGPGVTIGQGAVVGARAAVFKDVAPWTVVGGNPAKFIKNRVINTANK